MQAKWSAVERQRRAACAFLHGRKWGETVVVEDVFGNGSQTDAGWCEGWKAVEQTGLCAGMTKACPIEVPATDINRRKGKTVILQPLTISTTAFGVAKIDTSVE